MRERQAWQSDGQGVWATRVGSFRLMVLQDENYARFLISKPGPYGRQCPDMLLQSGTRQDVSTAKMAAEMEAERMEGLFVALHQAA